jgi:hypothetical protein
MAGTAAGRINADSAWKGLRASLMRQRLGTPQLLCMCPAPPNTPLWCPALGTSCARGAWLVPSPKLTPAPRLIMAKRMAFHSLLHQWRYATTRLMSRLISRPCTGGGALWEWHSRCNHPPDTRTPPPLPPKHHTPPHTLPPPGRCMPAGQSAARRRRTPRCRRGSRLAAPPWPSPSVGEQGEQVCVCVCARVCEE